MKTQTVQFSDGSLVAPIGMFDNYATDYMSVAKAQKVMKMLTDGGHRGDVEVMYEVDLLENVLYQGKSIQLDYMPAYFDVEEEELSNVLLNWAIENNAYLFSAPKEECFEWKAIEEAQKYGKAIVVINNLS